MPPLDKFHALNWEWEWGRYVYLLQFRLSSSLENNVSSNYGNGSWLFLSSTLISTHCYEVHSLCGTLLVVKACMYTYLYLHFEGIWWATGIVLDYEKYICRLFVWYLCHYEEHILHWTTRVLFVITISVTSTRSSFLHSHPGWLGTRMKLIHTNHFLPNNCWM